MECSIVWFRRDLRLLDNEAVSRATRGAKRCLFVFVVDPWYYEQPFAGFLRVKFLFESLVSLDASLRRSGNRLLVVKGESVATIIRLLEEVRASGHVPTLYFNRDIQGYHGVRRDTAVRKYCGRADVKLNETLSYFLLDDESEMQTWWRRYYDYQYEPLHQQPVVTSLPHDLLTVVSAFQPIDPSRLPHELGLRLSEPRQSLFHGGENAAREAVYSFLKDRVDGYRWKISRPYLAQLGATSLLGPHLAFGTISSRTVFQAAINHKRKLEARQPKKAFDIATYLDRLRWRDSFTQRLWFHPELAWKNRFHEFDELYKNEPPTGKQRDYFERWKNGTTGFPLLDAAMKQLKTDGFINFRMRAMAATFLTINCQVSWHHGARHFMNCLVDGDIAINHWQWQMQAGITNPLSPTFRMYNPTKNFRDRDASADYVHFWLPETAGKAVDTILSEAIPMLDFNETRKRNGKVISDIRKQVRERLTREKGSELDSASSMKRIVDNYSKRSADRYKRYSR